MRLRSTNLGREELLNGEKSIQYNRNNYPTLPSDIIKFSASKSPF
jgi:hypothetical protein